MIVSVDLSRIVEHYEELEVLQKRGTPEHTAYHKITGSLKEYRGSSIETQRREVIKLLHWIEETQHIGPLWVEVLRSMKMFLSKTGARYEPRSVSIRASGSKGVKRTA